MTITITPDHVGCWVDGHYGWRASGHLVRKAADFGFAIMPADEVRLDRWMKGDQDHDSDTETVVWLADRAEEWLNAHAPEGYHFGWQDGEFFMLTDAEDDDFEWRVTEQAGAELAAWLQVRRDQS